MELSDPKVMKNLHFLKKKKKTFLLYQEIELFSPKLKKLSYISGSNLQSLKNQKFLIFRFTFFVCFEKTFQT